MIINFNTYHSLKANKVATRALSFFVVFVFFLLSGLGCFILISERSQGSQVVQPVPKLTLPGALNVVSKPVNIDNVDPIKCKVLIPSPTLLGLEDELEIRGISSRPDELNPKVRLFLKQADQVKEMSCAQPFYLQFLHKNGEHRLAFSESATPIEGKISLQMPHKVQVSISWAIPLNSKLQEATFTLEAQPFLKKEENLQSLRALRQAAYYGKDAFINTLGGEEYAPLMTKGMLSFGGDSSNEVLYLKEGDHLYWTGIRWKKCEVIEAKGKPLAKVINVSAHEITFHYWDHTGFIQEEFSLRLTLPRSSTVVPEKLIQDAKLRASRRISCLFEGKKTFLSEGDWILKEADEWKIISSARQIQAFLDHKIKGDLIVLSKVVSNSTESYVEAFYFNPTRTQSKSFKIPVQRAPRKEPTSTRRKKFEEKMKLNLNSDERQQG